MVLGASRLCDAPRSAAGHAITWRTRDKGGSLLSFYLLFQSASSGLAMIDTSLYIFCLTMHYVEYHVLMTPRCFDVPLDPNSSTDRLFGVIRRNRFCSTR